MEKPIEANPPPDATEAAALLAIEETSIGAAKPYSQRRAMFELWIVPMLAILLPWRWVWRLYQRYLPASSLFAEPADRAWRGLQTVGPAITSQLNLIDQLTFRLRHQLTRLLDHVDVYLALFRPKFWIRRYARLSGSWPASAEKNRAQETQTGLLTNSSHGAFLALTFHWGCGLWALWQLRQQGICAHFLSIRVSRADFANRPVEYRYAQLRLWLVQRLTKAEVIYTQGAAEKIMQCWQRGEAVIAVMDVPGRGIGRHHGTQVMNVAGRPFHWPLGLPALAVQQQIPVLFFAGHIDWATGCRTIEVGAARVYTDTITCIEQLAETFSTLLQADPAAWHLAEFSGAFWD